MRVLVTRAEPNATRTAMKLREMGHEPVVLPLSQAIRAAGTAASALQNTSGPIAVTSAEALRVLCEIAPADRSWMSRVLYAVGPATAKAATELGFHTVFTGEGNAASLAERIVADVSARNRQAAPSHLLYLAGTPRTEGFEAVIAKAGIPVEICECYRMTAVVPDLATQQLSLITQSPQAVLCYSSESVRRLLQLPLLCERQEALAQALFCCMSDTVASTLPPRFRSHARIASTTSETELLTLLSG
ncbi:uroporphyrinogen-III synthase [Rhizobium halophytocola]|uniref:Uroporphyrinogen-III synthase n=1 Tax=Rhizobium halophytocola TaxID=735519 RepID=A0ABS4E2V6_9HYPH|nr:uroporphyrinogen-III synthase [Rhizobium halophytocola]MBP1852265.1 uroporphyrinogen-III synthase [Rhizobium halophytocola]